MKVSPQESLQDWKRRLLGHCGLDIAREPSFGLALGFSVLDESRSVTSNDVCAGDEVTLFERSSAVAELEAEVANLN